MSEGTETGIGKNLDGTGYKAKVLTEGSLIGKLTTDIPSHNLKLMVNWMTRHRPCLEIVMTVKYDNDEDEHRREELKQLFGPTNVKNISVRRWPDLSETRRLKVRDQYQLEKICENAEMAKRVIVVSIRQDLNRLDYDKMHRPISYTTLNPVVKPLREYLRSTPELEVVCFAPTKSTIVEKIDKIWTYIKQEQDKFPYHGLPNLKYSSRAPFMQCAEFALARGKCLTQEVKKAAKLCPLTKYTFNPEVLVHHPTQEALLSPVLSVTPGPMEALKAKFEALEQANSILKKSSDAEAAKSKEIVDDLTLQVTKAQTAKAGLCKDITELQEETTASKKKIGSMRKQRTAQEERIMELEEQQMDLNNEIITLSASNAQLVSLNETVEDCYATESRLMDLLCDYETKRRSQQALENEHAQLHSEPTKLSQMLSGLGSLPFFGHWRRGPSVLQGSGDSPEQQSEEPKAREEQQAKNEAQELRHAKNEQLLATTSAENTQLKETNTLLQKSSIEQKQQIEALQKTVLEGEKALEELKIAQVNAEAAAKQDVAKLQGRNQDLMEKMSGMRNLWLQAAELAKPDVWGR